MRQERRDSTERRIPHLIPEWVVEPVKLFMDMEERERGTGVGRGYCDDLLLNISHLRCPWDTQTDTATAMCSAWSGRRVWRRFQRPC